MWIGVLAFLLQAGEIDELLRAFADESIEIRQKAAERLLEKWKSWTDVELAKLEAATSSADAEVAKKAADCLAAIRFQRGIPVRARAAFPEVDRILRSGTPDEVAGLFDGLLARWRKRELASSEVLPLVMISLGDERKTSRTEFGKGGVWRMPASFPVYTLLHAVVPRFYYTSKPEEVRAWWADMRAKPERDWYLPDLTAADQRRRAGAIQRLFALNDPELHPQLFAALKTLEEDDSFGIGVQEAGALPVDVLRREFLPYLRDPRLKVRFLAAKLLHPTAPREALDGLSIAFEEGHAAKRLGFATELHEIVDWLVMTKDDRAFAALRVFLKAGDFHSRFSVLSALGYAEDERVDAVLVERFGDTDRSSGWMLSGDVRNPRLCDQAGILLARRLKLDVGKFEWPEDRIALRNANLAEIWKLYREKKGLPPAPFVPPGASLVAPEAVAALLPGLLAEDEGRRRTALAALSRLGAGAWPHLKEERLKDVALRFSNTLRRVEGDEALAERLHEPFDPDRFFRESIESWFADETLVEIEVEVAREPEGGGITVTRRLKKTPAGGAPFDQFSASGSGGGFMAWSRKSTFDEAWVKFFAPLKADMEKGSGATFKSALQMTKRRSK